jgi:HK97 family phage major capsid protein
VQAQMAELSDELEAIGETAANEGRDLDDAEQKIIDDSTERFAQLEVQASTLKKAVETKERMQAKRIVPHMLQESDMLAQANTPFDSKAGIPSKIRGQRSKVYDSSYECYAVGQWLGGVLGNKHARQWCIDRNFGFKNAMEEGTDSLGGYAVPDPMAATIIRLVEEHGVFRRFARNAAMTSDTLSVPKRTDGTTVYYPGEGGAITPSDITFGQVNLVAKKYAQLSIMSTELNEDSVISMTDLVTSEMAWNFAFSEDKNSFLGDGTGTFGGITGISDSLLAGSKVTASGATLGTIALANFNACVGKLPQYSAIMPRWFMNSYVYYTVVQPLLQGLGGTDQRQVEQGADGMLLGYPVTFTQVLPGSGAGTGDLAAVFGDLNMGAYLGTRRNVSIRLLNELYAANDQIGVVGTMRSDTKIHDTGDATNAGSIIGLYLA